MVIIHDRHVTTATNILPGSSSFDINRSLGANIDIADSNLVITNGPKGTLNDSNLDGGNSSHHGYVLSSSLPSGSVSALNTGTSGRSVTFSYAYGDGSVVYSTLPLVF